MAFSRTCLLLVLCVGGIALATADDAMQQLETRIDASVQKHLKEQFESDLNTQITKLIDERLPATVTPQVEDTFNKHTSKIVDEVLKVVNARDEEDEAASAAAVDEERLQAAEAASKAAEAQVAALLKRIDSLESGLAEAGKSSKASSDDTDKRIKSLETAQATLKAQPAEASGGINEAAVDAKIATEFGVLKIQNDALEKTAHSLQLKIGELKTIIDNPTNGVQGELKNIEAKVKKFQGELDDVRTNVVREQFKENRDLVNKNKASIEQATSHITAAQSKITANKEADAKLKAATDKAAKHLEDMLKKITERVEQVEENVKGGIDFAKYVILAKSWTTSTYDRLYRDVWVEHVLNFDAAKFGQALISTGQQVAETVKTFAVFALEFAQQKFAAFLEWARTDLEPLARRVAGDVSTWAADLAARAQKNAGPMMQDAQKAAVKYSKEAQKQAIRLAGEGEALYHKLHAEAVQQFLDMKLDKDMAVLAASALLLGGLGLVALLTLYITYKMVAGFFSCLCGACCGRSSAKKPKKSKKRSEAGGGADEPAASSSASPKGSSSGRKKGKGKKKGRFDTM